MQCDDLEECPAGQVRRGGCICVPEPKLEHFKELCELLKIAASNWKLGNKAIWTKYFFLLDVLKCLLLQILKSEIYLFMYVLKKVF